LIYGCKDIKKEIIQGNNLPKIEKIQGNNSAKIEKIQGNNFLLSDEMHKKPLLSRFFSFTIRLFSPLFSQHELI
jgi:hypothetical protein